MLDSRHRIETPEGITLEIRPAGPVARFYAWAIDLLIRGAFYLVIVVALSSLGKMGWGIAMILLFVTEWFYPVLFEVLREGATPGKRALGLKVLHDDASPVDWNSSVIRNLLRSIDILPGSYAFGLISMLLNRDFKRLGDIVAGTLVVYEDSRIPLNAATSKTSIAPHFPLGLEEQQAILSFADRHPGITADRSDELAQLTGPLIDNKANPTQQLLSIAAWIRGERK